MLVLQEKCTAASSILFNNKNKNLFDLATDKPKIIINYNKTNGGVKVIDKLCTATQLCTYKLSLTNGQFYGCLNVAEINLNFVQEACNNISYPRRQYLDNLAF